MTKSTSLGSLYQVCILNGVVPAVSVHLVQDYQEVKQVNDCLNTTIKVSTGHACGFML